MKPIKAFIALTTGLFFTGLAHDAGSVNMPVEIGSASYIKKNVRTMQDMKFRNVVRQTREYSCGAAALSTVLQYYFGREVPENKILENILNGASPEKREDVIRKGISLLDIKKSAETYGYKGTGLRVPESVLEKLDRPAIVLVNNRGFLHFVVLKGVKGGKAFIADPAMGNLVWGRREFVEKWNGILLLLSDPGSREAKSHALEISDVSERKNKTDFFAGQYYLQFVINPSEF